MYRHAERQTERQKDEQAIRKVVQAGRKMNKQSGRCTGRQKDEQAVRKMYSQAER